jgi:hypothetical protein
MGFSAVRAETPSSVDLQMHGDRPAHRRGGCGVDEPKMIALQPFPHEVGRHEKLQDPVVQSGGAHVREPHRDGGFRKLAAGLLDDVGPRLAGLVLRERYRHAFPQNLSTTVEISSGEGDTAIVRRGMRPRLGGRRRG